MSNKKMTPEQKKAMEMKYEIAGELGLLEKVKKVGLDCAHSSPPFPPK